MEGRVNPDLEDTVSTLQLRRWFDDSDRSLTEQTYGSQLLWRSLDEDAPALLPAYLDRLGAPRPPRSAAALLAGTYARVTGRRFAPAFARFAGRIAAEESDRIRPVATVDLGTTKASRVAPLAIHFVRLGRSVRSVAVRVTGGRADLALVYRLDSEYAGNPAATRRLRARAVGDEQVFEIPPALRRNRRFALATLVVANGDGTHAAAYSLRIR